MEEIDFVAKSTASAVDDRVYDGNNYKGLMRPKDYVAKREQVKEGEEAFRARRIKEIRERDVEAKAHEARVRDERLKRKKEQLKDELASSAAEAAPAADSIPSAKPLKGKRSKGAAPAASNNKLSFDDDE